MGLPSRQAFYALPEVVQEEWIAAWEAEQEEERNRCPQCGGDRATCSNPEVEWFPQRDICWRTAARNEVDGRYGRLYKDRPYHDGAFGSFAKDPSPQHPFHVRDGVTIWVSEHDLTPEDDFLREQKPDLGETLADRFASSDPAASSDQAPGSAGR